jgi:FkbM family methyltransferase
MSASLREVFMLRVFQDLKRLRENLPLELAWKLTERRVIKSRITTKAPVILDVGSNLGSSIAFYRGLFPKALIVGFEPDPDTFRHLQGRFKSDRDVRLFNKGVGDRSERRQLNRNAVSATNSLHEMNRESEWVKSAASVLRDVAPVEIELVTLDDVANELSLEKIDYLKSDTQGHEPEVLAGAQRVLREKRIALIKLEVQAGDFYVRQVPLFTLEQALCPLGYELISINDMHIDGKGGIKYFDAFFGLPS